VFWRGGSGKLWGSGKMGTGIDLQVLERAAARAARQPPQGKTWEVLSSKVPKATVLGKSLTVQIK